jgi:sucrose phosphorylase
LAAQHKPSDGFDAHQINCTYYSALDCNDDAYIAARAIQFFAPGVPQVYYVGLLAGENDQTEIARTGERRAINRHNYSQEEIEDQLHKPVVERLLDLIRFRNEHRSFQGAFEVIPTGDQVLKLAWQNGESRSTLTVDLATDRTWIEYQDSKGAPVRCIP